MLSTEIYINEICFNMIGNDIVDLEFAKIESNWKRKGYLDKIFSQKEQLLVTSAINSELMVWNLWSRKEAAYKIYNRQTGISGYFPLKLKCYYQSSVLGTVNINGNIYYTQTQISNDYIYTIAVTKKKYFNKIKKVSNNSEINKINGVPFIIDTKNNTKKPVSISHHGRFSESITI